MLTGLIGDKELNLINTKYSSNDIKKWCNKNIVKCPICGKPYEYCNGKIIIPYFRHKDKSECIYSYYEQETFEHLRGKIDLYLLLKQFPSIRNLKLEAWVPETKQRPDLYFLDNGVKTVIEFQCTPISSEYYERHELYQAANIHDIWICGAQKFFQDYHNGNGLKKVSVLENESKIYYDPQTKLIFVIDSSINERFYRNMIWLKYGKEKINHKMVKPFDYLRGYNNYYFIKDHIKSYKDYIFESNKSLAYCYKLEEFLYGWNKCASI